MEEHVLEVCTAQGGGSSRSSPGRCLGQRRFAVVGMQQETLRGSWQGDPAWHEQSPREADGWGHSVEQMVSAPPQAWESGNLINGFSFRVHLINFLSTSNFPKVRDLQINFEKNSLIWKLNYPTRHLFQLLFPSLRLRALFNSAAMLWKMNFLAFRLSVLCSLQASSLTSLCCCISPHKSFRLTSFPAWSCHPNNGGGSWGPSALSGVWEPPRASIALSVAWTGCVCNLLWRGRAQNCRYNTRRGEIGIF